MLPKLMNKLRPVWLLMLAFTMLIATGCQLSSFNEKLNAPSSAINEQVGQSSDSEQPIENSNAPLTGFKEVADYIRQHGKLPDNYITKQEARDLGWVPAEGNLHLVAPNKSIGGDKFGNREGLLPQSDGRIWYEADINYKSGTRNADRIVFSNDGLIYMTTDHYKSFTDITKEDSIINE